MLLRTVVVIIINSPFQPSDFFTESTADICSNYSEIEFEIRVMGKFNIET